MACAFARLPGCADIAQDRGEHRDCCRVLYPLGKLRALPSGYAHEFADIGSLIGSLVQSDPQRIICVVVCDAAGRVMIGLARGLRIAQGK